MGKKKGVPGLVTGTLDRQVRVTIYPRFGKPRVQVHSVYQEQMRLRELEAQEREARYARLVPSVVQTGSDVAGPSASAKEVECDRDHPENEQAGDVNTAYSAPSEKERESRERQPTHLSASEGQSTIGKGLVILKHKTLSGATQSKALARPSGYIAALALARSAFELGGGSEVYLVSDVFAGQSEVEITASAWEALVNSSKDSPIVLSVHVRPSSSRKRKRSVDLDLSANSAPGPAAGAGARSKQSRLSGIPFNLPDSDSEDERDAGDYTRVLRGRETKEDVARLYGKERLEHNPGNSEEQLLDAWSWLEKETAGKEAELGQTVAAKDLKGKGKQRESDVSTPEGADRVTIDVVGVGGRRRYNVNTRDRLSKVLRSFALHAKTPLASLVFTVNGIVATGINTPEELGLEEGDELQVSIAEKRTTRQSKG